MNTSTRAHRANVISIQEFSRRELEPLRTEDSAGTGPHPAFQGKNGSGKVIQTMSSVILASAIHEIPEVQFTVISLGNDQYEYGIFDMLPQLVGVYENPEPQELDAILTAIIDSRQEYPDAQHLYVMFDTPPVLSTTTARSLRDALERIETEGAHVGVTAVVYPGYGLRDAAA